MDGLTYRPGNVLFREMVAALRPPAWCHKVIVVADAAYASRANLACLAARGYWYIVALPRTWILSKGKSRKTRLSPSV